MATELENVKVFLTQLQAREKQIRQQSTDATTLVSTEQNRWADYNNRLDELERVLPQTGGR